MGLGSEGLWEKFGGYFRSSNPSILLSVGGPATLYEISVRYGISMPHRSALNAQAKYLSLKTGIDALQMPRDDPKTTLSLEIRSLSPLLRHG